MATVVNRQTMSDAELIAASRTGDDTAYGELYVRHLPAARAAARAMCRNRSDADDLVSEAFVNVLRLLQEGNGPELAFRPYLLVAVRNRFYDKTRRRREEPIDQATNELDIRLIDGSAGHEDRMLVAAAFATLPERWQLVLWHTEVEGRSPAEVAPLIGLAPNAVAALAYRAREGLREAFLQAHLQTPREAECRDCAGQLGAYVRDSLADRDRRKVDSHLYGCSSCRALLAELTDTNTMLRAALLPAIVGVPATAYLSGLGGKGLVARFGRMSRLHQTIAAGAAAAAVVAIGVTSVVALTGGSSPAIADPYTLPPRQMTGTIVPPTTISFLPSASATSTSIELASSPPVPVPSEMPTSGAAPVSVNRPPLRTAPRGVATTVPDTVASGTTPTTGTTTPATGTLPTPVTTQPRGTTPPRVTPTTTVAPPTSPATTVPIVPRLGLTSLQLGVGLLGGEVRVQLTVAATALPASQFRTNAVSNVIVSSPLPAGVSLIAADNPAWTCTVQGACTIAALATGKTSTSVLRLGLAADVVSPITFAPTVTNPVNAVVLSQPLSIATRSIAGLKIQEYTRGSVATIGNTVQDCAVLPCVPVDVDTDQNTINSSTADLKFTGTVAKAILVWSGDSLATERGTVQFMTPSGPVPVVADFIRGDDYSPDYTDEYVAYADVTAQLAASGTYGVANLQTAATSFGGWSLTVLTHDSTQPERSLMIVLPLSYVTATASSSLAIGGFASPAAHVVVSAFEGDEKLAGDTVTLGGLDVGGVDPFRGAIFGVPRNPELLRNARVDVLDVVTTNVAAGASLDFASTDDPVMIAAVGISLDL